MHCPVCKIDTLHFMKDMINKRLSNGNRDNKEDIEKDDGTDITEMIEKAVKWLTENSF